MVAIVVAAMVGFQSHAGSIEANFFDTSVEALGHVSIPRWFD